MNITSFSHEWWLYFIAGALIVAAIAIFSPAEVEYPNHKRVPNPIVRGLYSVGYFIADFGPMFVNLFNAVYLNIRKLFAFIVGLLIEISFVVILIATIGFSISHSMELLEEAGATGYLKYLGILIFELSFISSATALTAAFMKKKKPHWFLYIGFVVGIAFVLWSNISQMNQNWTGWIIGVLIPLMLIIAEGTIAFQNRDDNQNEIPNEEPDTKLKWYQKLLEKKPNQPSETNQEVEPKPIRNDTKIPDDFGIKTEPDQTLVPNLIEEPTKNDSKTGTDPDQNTHQNDDQNSVENQPEDTNQNPEEPSEVPELEVPEPNQKIASGTVLEMIENDTKEPTESGINANQEVVPNSADEPTKTEPDTNQENDQVPDQNFNQISNQINQIYEPKLIQDDDQNLVESDTKNEPEQPTKADQKVVVNGAKTPTKNTTKRATKTTKTRSDSSDTRLRKAKQWALKYYQENGKAPGRGILEKELNLTQPQAREIAKEIKKELGIKAS